MPGSDGPPAVVIESLGAGGAGVAHLDDGMITFVQRTAPGDRVVLRAIRRHRRHAEARVEAVLEPGPSRVEPPCRHYTGDRCGGCQWQHVSADAQREAKGAIVANALRRIGGLAVDAVPVIASPRQFQYRTTITLAVRRRASHVVAGFHDLFDPDRVFMLDTCPIARDEINALWRCVRGALGSLPQGEVRLMLRVAPDGSRHAVVVGGDGAWMGGEDVAGAVEQAGAGPATVWWHPEGGAPRRVGGAEADPAAISFTQVNEEVAARLREDVLAAARQAAGAHGRIADLYAGAGETALPLASDGHDVTMVELDGRAVRRAESLAAARGVTLRCIAGRVEDHLEKIAPADVVIVNPPRTGLSEDAAAALGHAARRLIYVSCDPATLARDLRRMGIAAERMRVQAYDMFPQTSHVETLVVAERQG